MTRRDLLHAGREVRALVVAVAVPFAVGYALTFPFALAAAVRRYRKEIMS